MHLLNAALEMAFAAAEYFTWALYPGLLFLGLEIALAHTRFRRVP